MSHRAPTIGMLGGLLLALSGTGAPALATPAVPDAARTFYKTKCQVCHGATGEGDGPGAKNLKPRPKTFRDPEWQQSVTDEYLQKVILKGGVAVGKSPGMPGHRSLKKKPDVLDGLVLMVREFGG